MVLPEELEAFGPELPDDLEEDPPEEKDLEALDDLVPEFRETFEGADLEPEDLLTELLPEDLP